MIQTFFSTFTYLFERKGMSQKQFADYINAQPLPKRPPFRHPLPLNQGTISRILSGSIPDEITLFRIAYCGFFDFNEALCDKLENLRWEAFLLAQEEKRTTQQMAAIKIHPITEEIEVKDHREPKIPDWIYA